MNLFKKILSTTLAFVVLFGASYSVVQAQGIQDYIDASGSEQQISSEKLAVRYNMPNMLAAMGVAITGGKTSVTEEVISIGAIPQVGQYIAFLSTTPPVQTSTYIADILQNTGLAQPAYAQGVGFSALTPILRVWKAFRNIAYFFAILVFIVIGFMIMFRKQIDHGTVITIQMALPKIIVTLILITFSYAIVGLVVDLIYLTIFLATESFSAFGLINNPSQTREVLLSKNILRVGWSYLIGSGELVGGAAGSASNIIRESLGAPLLLGVVNILTYLVMAIALIIALFRTLFSLIGAYVSIIISTIFAPIQLLFNAFPGSNTFSGWIKGIVANAAVFPAVAIMIMVGSSLTAVNNPSNSDLGINVPAGVGWGGQDDSGWVPPLIGRSGSNLGLQSAQGIIGFGIIMLLPEIAAIIKKALGAESEVGQMAMAGFQRGSGAVGAPFAWLGGAAVSGASLKLGSSLYDGTASRKIKEWKQKRIDANEPKVDESWMDNGGLEARLDAFSGSAGKSTSFEKSARAKVDDDANKK